MAHVNVNPAETVERASGGRALKGCFPLNDDIQQSVGRHILLKPSSKLTLMNPNQSSFCATHCFSKLEDSTSFCKDVTEKGWSIATGIHTDNMLWSSLRLGTSGKRLNQEGALNTLSLETSEACITQCIYVPMASFQIQRDQLILSDSALHRARSIQDGLVADDFLERFNPFVSLAMYHLGGIFFRQVTIKCAEQTRVQQIVHQIGAEISVNARVNVLLGIGGGTEGSYRTFGENSSLNDSAFRVKERKELSMACGPTTAQSAEELISMLKEDTFYWTIIDKDVDDEGSLVGVWELLLQHSEHLQVGGADADAIALKRASKILCQQWLYRADRQLGKSCTLSSRATVYSKLIDNARVFMHKLLIPSPPSPPSPSSPPELASVSSLIETLQAILQNADGYLLYDAVDTQVRLFIKNNADTQKQDCRDAINILQSYGFDNSGNSGDFDISHILSDMIEELKKQTDQPIVWVDHEDISIPETVWIESKPTEFGWLRKTSFKHTIQYVGWLVVDRRFNENSLVSIPHDAASNPQQKYINLGARRYIDCLRHRVNPQEHVLPLGPSQGGTESCIQSTWSDCSDSESNDEVDEEATEGQNRESDQNFSLLEILVYIFQCSDLPAKIELCNLLLLQRASTVLAFPLQTVDSNTEHNHSHKQLQHSIDALRYVDVAVQNEHKVCIAEDVSLRRVVFLSDKGVHESHSATLASRILNCNFVSQHNCGGMGQIHSFPVIEVGIGFVSVPQKGTTNCIALHVTGTYQQLFHFIETSADIVILELRKGTQKSSNWARFKEMRKSLKVLQWLETEGGEGFDKRKKLIKGQESFLVQQLSVFLLGESEGLSQKSQRTSLSEECIKCFLPNEIINFKQIEQVLDESLPSNIRKDLKLQKSLSIEAQTFFESLRHKHNLIVQRAKDRACAKQKASRLRLAKDITRIPILRLFYKLLCQGDAESRIVGIMSLERALSRKMQPLLGKLAWKVDALYEAYNNDRNNTTVKEAYIRAKNDYVDKSIGLENLWRELSLIFEADPINQRHLAELAAQHLMDSFPLEIYDGDAGMYRKSWIETVLVELNTIIRKNNKAARIFVISVMGLQSSGKSTMLNLMFGTRLRTSAGRCTRGVYMQLVQSERSEYDYVILIDTEGLRSNEYFGLDQAEVRDNRLATFGLLPADASVFMVTNEDDSGLKEVLPMVLLAFKNSSIAERYYGRIKSKMFFVYRSVDTNDRSRLKVNKQKLHEYLREAAEKVSLMSNTDEKRNQKSVNTQEANELFRIAFSDLRVLDNESKGDVRCMGNLKRGSNPPWDIPDWSYGEAVIKLMEHIHHRVTSDRCWEPTNLTDWSEHLTRVWDCICTADFELSFKTCVEYSSYKELEKALQQPRTKLGQTYDHVFKGLEKTVREMKDEEDISTLFRILHTEVQDVVRSETERVTNIVKQERWAKWEIEKQTEWNNFCRELEAFYKRRVEDLESGIRRFESVVTQYEIRCKCMIVEGMESGKWQLQQSTRAERTMEFDKFFKKILHEAEMTYPRIAEQVRKRVMHHYDLSGLTREHDLHNNPTRKQPTDHVICPMWGVKHKSKTTSREKLQLRDKLDQIIEQGVKDVRQYSDVVVAGLIKETSDAIDQVIHSKKHKRKEHYWIKEKLIRRMESIQRQWDEQHNVAGRLESSKTRLLRFFLDRAEGLEAAAMLINDLQRILKDELQEAFKRSVIARSSSVIGRKDWMMDWRALRDVMDYHLLGLIERKQFQKAIEYVRDESTHFQKVVDVLIQQVIIEERLAETEWEDLLNKVERCLQLQTSSKETELNVFLLQLKRRLEREVDHELAHKVFSPLYQDNLKLQLYVLDNEFYEKKVPDLCQSLKKMVMPTTIANLVQAVKERLEALAQDQCRPRCETRCRTCLSACFHHKGHDLEVTKHDCIHQPAGLSGALWDDTKELSETNCFQDLESWSHRFVVDGGKKRVSFKKFEKYFPSWKKPAKYNSSAIQLREWIFYNCQGELQCFFSKVRKIHIRTCPKKKMPQYNHNLRSIQTDVKNRLITRQMNLKALDEVLKSL